MAGRAKGHRIRTPDHDRTRPTSERVRESAFNLIAGWAGTAGEPGASMLERFSFLDLFAGSGGMALEAASRGAAPVVCVEVHRPTAALAKANADAMGVGLTVVAESVEAFLAGPPRPFDVVWLDPPYDLATAAVEAIVTRVAAAWLADDGLVVVERATRGVPPRWPDALGDRRERRYGETTLFLAAKEAP